MFEIPTLKMLSIISQWVLKNIEKREFSFIKLLQSFQWNTFEPNEVFKHLETSVLYTKSEVCLYQILHCLTQNSWMLSNYKNKYDALHIKFQQLLANEEKVIEQECKLGDKKMLNDGDEHQKDVNVLMIKTKQNNRKQMLLKRLMLFGLKPSLRMAALKMLMVKKKKISVCDLSNDDFEGMVLLYFITYPVIKCGYYLIYVLICVRFRDMHFLIYVSFFPCKYLVLYRDKLN